MLSVSPSGCMACPYNSQARHVLLYVWSLCSYYWQSANYCQPSETCEKQTSFLFSFRLVLNSYRHFACDYSNKDINSNSEMAVRSLSYLRCSKTFYLYILALQSSFVCLQCFWFFLVFLQWLSRKEVLFLNKTLPQHAGSNLRPSGCGLETKTTAPPFNP